MKCSHPDYSQALLQDAAKQARKRKFRHNAYMERTADKHDGKLDAGYTLAAECAFNRILRMYRSVEAQGFNPQKPLFFYLQIGR